jgi:hypothetical protein
MKSFNTSIYNNDQLSGLDYEVLLVQQKLARITWMESIFGVCIKQTDSKNRRTYPQGKKFNQDIDLTFNDQYASTCFFLHDDPIDINPKTDTDDWTDENVEISQPVSLLFFCNLSKLENQSKEQIKTCILYELNKCAKIQLRSALEEINGVWSGFTITDNVIQYSKYPYYCLRVNMIFTYMAFPFNGNNQFNPNIYDDPNKESITINSSVGKANLS